MNNFFIGLDLGQRQDYTAMAVVQRVAVPVGEVDHATYEQRTEMRLHVRHLERLRLGTSYIRVVERVGEVVGAAGVAGRCTLVVDATGVGGPVLDLLKAAGLGCPIVGVSITGGERATRVGEGWRVPKRELMAGLQIVLGAGELKIAKGLGEARALVDEIVRMRVTISEGGHERYGAQYGTHDDLVLAAALAVWKARASAVSRCGGRGVWGCRGGIVFRGLNEPMPQTCSGRPSRAHKCWGKQQGRPFGE